jgi:hypothetical protein
MKFAQVVQSILVALAMVAGTPARAADIVYDNSTDYSGTDYESTNEYGDEVTLGGVARLVTEIQIEYWADFVPQGDEIGRVRFYKNTGPFWHGAADSPTPAAPPIYEETFQLFTGYQTEVITAPNVVVPDDFTWTVQFLGISQAVTPVNDRAGLLFYGTPTVGSSLDDFWELTPTGWDLFQRTDVPKNNFGVRILAIAFPTLRIARSGNNIVITWPTASAGFVLQSTSDLTNRTWTNVSTTPTVNGSNNQVTLPTSGTVKVFRLQSP